MNYKHITHILLALFLLVGNQTVSAQKFKKQDKRLVKKLESHITFLADDKLEGRRTGTAGEKLAYEYIGAKFAKAGLLPAGDNQTFIQAFNVYEGKKINANSVLMINGNDLKIEKEYFPLAFSANGAAESITSLALQEAGNIWLLDIKDKIEENKNNPHFDLMNAVRSMADEASKKGATALIVYNTTKADDLKFESKLKIEPVTIPVLYLTKDAKKMYLKNVTALLDIKLKASLSEINKTGHNVIGYINNGAPFTVIIGAHYDHLGYGEDHSSLYSGAEPMIHNGADDNASGTAAVIEFGGMLKKSKYKKNNYLFICFSGEELGLLGSKYFVEHPTIDLSKVDYMINMDMIGRLSDSTHALTIGGFGTSATWGEIISQQNDYFTIKLDSSGTGPSDHTSFYRKNIPVLFFFTGLHKDYHKPSDDADKINYSGEALVINYIYDIIATADKKAKLPFAKTREVVMSGKSNFKVTLGIMPDYAFSGNGVRVDGVSEDRPAQKAGIKEGDVLVQLGDHKFSDMQTYMEALNKFNKGDATTVKLKRGGKELIVDIVF